MQPQAAALNAHHMSYHAIVPALIAWLWLYVYREVVGSAMGRLIIFRTFTGPGAYMFDKQVHEAKLNDALFDVFHRLSIRDRKVLACVKWHYVG